MPTDRINQTIILKDDRRLGFAEYGALTGRPVFHFHGSGSPKHWPATLDLTGGEVIATDQDGRPALVAHQYGKGKTLLCAYPLESALAMTPAAFETEEMTHRLYRAFSQWAGIRPLFRTSEPSVEVAALSGPDRGYAILASHSPQVQQVTVTTSLPIKSIRQVLEEGTRPVDLANGSWTMPIDPYEGAIIEWML